MTIFVCGVPESGVKLLQKYLHTFCKDAKVEVLKPVAVRGRVKTRGSRADVGLIILEAAVWSSCAKLARDVVESPKCHKYLDDKGLEQFLSNF